ncbi:MAG: hypothetical protein WD648_11475 [Planctomycetaceae bacterium]
MAETVRTQLHIQPENTDDPTLDLPLALPIELTVRDPVTVVELYAYPEGPERDEFALNALRIGVLALKQARGQVDADLVRRESERLLDNLESRLKMHTGSLNDLLAASLKKYFDPADGQFHERVERLVKQDGELEVLLRRQIGQQDSELVKTLAAHFGEQSPLMKCLSPNQSQGLLASLRETLDQQLMAQREHVLGQFSLDNKDGALSRFIAELTDRQGELSQELNGKIDGVVSQFSLDDENSALSRLVRNVDLAQKRITSEFSLDEEKSALARLKRELLDLFEQDRETSRKFQEEVKSTLHAMVARKQEADRSTRHGLVFEDAVFSSIQYEAQRLGDVATQTGNSTGQIRNCKVGDCVIELGPETAAPGARIAIEAKEQAGYNLATARSEIETARENRNAQVGLFVFSKRTACDGTEPLARYGNDVFVAWDAEDAQTDLFLRTGYTLARALCVRGRENFAAGAADFAEIDKAILEIEKRAEGLEELTKWTETIQSNSEKILKKVRATRQSLDKQAELLREKTDELRDILAGDVSA